MLFSSLSFLFFFLPLTFLLYFTVPRGWRNAVLLAVSLIFYALGEPIYVLLMLGTVLADFALGLITARAKTRQTRMRWLWTAVGLHVSLLVLFKYGAWLGLPSIPLPLGISFYTFQGLSYVIDVYRGDCLPERSAVRFGTYVTLFPQLVAGPIVRFTEVNEALQHRTHTLPTVASGLRTFLCGLGKKVLLANTAGQMWDRLRSLPPSGHTVLSDTLAIVFFAFQIYYDFSGYSDMAVGLGRCFGFSFPQNFRYPYTAISVTDFWRRWHITLSAFFREYVYIPLGGNRHGRWRMVGSMLAVWVLTGLWHGDTLNFLLWGLYFFLLLLLEKLFLLRLAEHLPLFVRRATTFFAVLVGWVIFASDGTNGLSLSWGLSYIGSMLGLGGIPLLNAEGLYELSRNLLFLAVLAVGATPLPLRLCRRLSQKRPRLVRGASLALCFPLLLLCTAYLVSSSYNPFLYFRF